MKKRDGFALTEGLVALTILAVLVVGAYTVWQRPAVDESSTTPTVTLPVTVTEAPTRTPKTTTPTPTSGVVGEITDLKTSQIILRQEYPVIPPIGEIIDRSIKNKEEVQTVFLEENTAERMQLLIFLDPKDNSQDPTLDEIHSGWIWNGAASSPCYTNTGYYQENLDLGLMMAIGQDENAFASAGVAFTPGSDHFGCVEHKQYVEIIYEKNSIQWR